MAVAVAGAIALATSSARAHTKTTQVSWTVDVAPILTARCVRCHQPGGFGPMSLATYNEARTWAVRVRNEVLSGRMPPWSAVQGFGDFSNDASLTPVEIELIARWADGNAPLGPQVTAHISVMTPRADRAGARRFELPPHSVSGAAVATVSLPTAFAGDRWIAGWQFEPGNRSLVEEAVLMINGASIGGWTPFDGPIAYPRGMADRLPKGADLSVAVRYRKSSEPQMDRSAVTLDFGPKPSHEMKHLLVGCGSHLVDQDMTLLAVKPQASAAGDAIEVATYHPDAAIDPLCVVFRYRPEYAVTYRLRTPVRLERGSSVTVRASSTNCAARLDYVMR
jgi:mono/diheme cytochrome c family protein